MNFAVYSKDGCPFCDRIKQVLELGNFNFVVYDLNKNFDRDSFYGSSSSCKWKEIRWMSRNS